MIRPSFSTRREYRRTGADHDARFSMPDAMPLLGALAGRERGVQQRDVVPNAAVQLAGHRGSEADLGHQQNGGPSQQEDALIAAR